MSGELKRFNCDESPWIAHDSGVDVPEKKRKSMHEFTASELRNISETVPLKLRPEFISFRQGNAGIKVPYLEGFRAINLANEVFGFNGWSSQIISSNVEFFDTLPDSRVSIAVNAVVRITLKDGCFREDMGFGFVQNGRSKAEAFQKARKEAVTDAYKRTIRQFGSVFGNCLYDKDYVRSISKLKTRPVLFTEESLYPKPQCQPAVDDVANQSLRPSTKPFADSPFADPSFANPPFANPPFGANQSKEPAVLPTSSALAPGSALATGPALPPPIHKIKINAPLPIVNPPHMPKQSIVSKNLNAVSKSFDDTTEYHCLSDSLEVAIIDSIELEQQLDYNYSAALHDTNKKSSAAYSEFADSWPSFSGDDSENRKI